MGRRSNSVMRKPRQRSAAQITACGHKGATLQTSGLGGSDTGFLPFPVHKLSSVIMDVDYSHVSRFECPT